MSTQSVTQRSADGGNTAQNLPDVKIDYPEYVKEGVEDVKGFGRDLWGASWWSRRMNTFGLERGTGQAHRHSEGDHGG